MKDSGHITGSKNTALRVLYRVFDRRLPLFPIDKNDPSRHFRKCNIARRRLWIFLQKQLHVEFMEIVDLKYSFSQKSSVDFLVEERIAKFSFLWIPRSNYVPVGAPLSMKVSVEMYLLCDGAEWFVESIKFLILDETQETPFVEHNKIFAIFYRY